MRFSLGVSGLVKRPLVFLFSDVSKYYHVSKGLQMHIKH